MRNQKTQKLVKASLMLAMIWGGLFSFNLRFNCHRPSYEEFLKDKEIKSYVVESAYKPHKFARVETAMLGKIRRFGKDESKFNPEVDYVEYVEKDGSTFMSLAGGRWNQVSEESVRGSQPNSIGLSDFYSGNFPRTFKYGFIHTTRKHACVMFYARPSGGSDHYEFLHLFRTIFGAWWVLSTGSINFWY
jgi:hypothetical protein